MNLPLIYNTTRAACLRAAVIGCAALIFSSAAAEEKLPPALNDVGIDQKLDTLLPLDLKFVDETGASVELGDYFHQEKPVLLSLVYFECPMLCTLVLDGMVRTLQEIDWVPGEQFEIISVSIDPTEPPKLAQLKKQNYLRSYGRQGADKGWHFLTGSQESISALAEAVGFGYRYLPEQEEFAHPAALFVLTPEGRTSRYLYGVQHDPRTMRLSLVEAAEGTIGSPMDKFLLYCYRYDSEEGRYAPVAMRIMRLGAGAVAIALVAMLTAFWMRESRQRKRLA